MKNETAGRSGVSIARSRLQIPTQKEDQEAKMQRSVILIILAISFSPLGQAQSHLSVQKFSLSKEQEQKLASANVCQVNAKVKVHSESSNVDRFAEVLCGSEQKFSFSDRETTEKKEEGCPYWVQDISDRMLQQVRSLGFIHSVCQLGIDTVERSCNINCEVSK